LITAIVVVLVVLLVLAVTAAGASVRVLREYERGVVFRLGRLMELRGPGLIMLVPTIDRMVRVSLRTVTLTVPPQEVITRDNVPARVAAVAYYRVIDPNHAVNEVENFHAATLQIAQTTLRSVLGGVDLDTLLSERERLNESLQQIIDSQTEPWGIKVTTVEIKDVEIPQSMQHAIARQAEAERERRAKIINAEGEAQAAAKLAEAADVIGRNPTTLQLRYLQTLREIGANQNSTVVFPMPIDLVRPVLQAIAEGGGAGQERPEHGTLGAGDERPEHGALGAGDERPEHGALGAGDERQVTGTLPQGDQSEFEGAPARPVGIPAPADERTAR
jgi:regulator of protease activity HflC (stomatin/prohibitin superfamily)